VSFRLRFSPQVSNTTHLGIEALVVAARLRRNFRILIDVSKGNSLSLVASLLRLIRNFPLSFILRFETPTARLADVQSSALEAKSNNFQVPGGCSESFSFSRGFGCWPRRGGHS